MTSSYPSTGEVRRHRGLSSSQHQNHTSTVDDLLEENAKLKKLIVELSKLAIKNAAERH